MKQHRFLGEFNTRQARVWLFAVLLLAAGLRLWVAWQPVDVLVEKNLPDDAFYYFVLARNAVQEGSVSLDGVSPTNGFHPLWFMLITPIFGTAEVGNESAIHAALTLASVLDVATIWLIAQLTAKFTQRWQVGLLAAGLYAINPIVILQVTNGLETAVGMLALVGFLCCFAKWPQDERGSAVWVGILGGLMFLARSDSLFLFGFAMISTLWLWRGRERWIQVLRAGAAALLTVTPWLAWSYFSVGSIFQESGSAVPFALRVRYALENGSGWQASLSESLRQLAELGVWLRGDFSGLPFIVGNGLWLLVAGLLILRWRRGRGERIERAILLPLLASGLALVLAHAGWRWFPRPWYFIPNALTFAIGGAILLNEIKRPLLRFASALSLCIYLLMAGSVFWQVGYYPWQRQMLAANGWLAANVNSDQTVASFNSGIYAYYNDFRVMNLDGVVNHDAYEAIQAGTLMAYIQRSGVDWLVDTDRAIFEEYAPFMGAGFPKGLNEISVLSDDMGAAFGALRAYDVPD
jgi:hypothetical protein